MVDSTCLPELQPFHVLKKAAGKQAYPAISFFEKQ